MFGKAGLGGLMKQAQQHRSPQPLKPLRAKK